jgi:hypothetical protein
MKKRSDYQYLIGDLDKVLNFIAGSYGIGGIDFDQLARLLWEKNIMPVRNNPADHLLKILEKLVKDGNLMTWEWQHNHVEFGLTTKKTHTMYKATWDGIYFTQTGGYQHNISEKNRLSSLEKKVKTIAIAAFMLSILTVLFTAATFCLKIWEDFFKK